jgi:hypothetical protein
MMPVDVLLFAMRLEVEMRKVALRGHNRREGGSLLPRQFRDRKMGTATAT